MKGRTMFTRSFLILSTLVISALLVVGITGCGGNETAEAQTTPEENANALTVRVERLEPKPMVEALTVAGIVKAYDDVMLSPEEGGVVKEWKVRKGEPVRRNELVAILKDEVIKASFEAADAQYKMSQLNYEKQRKVYEEQGISELQYRNLEYGRDAAKANADLMKARLQRTQIKSPVDGILDEQYADAGEFAPPGAPLAHIVNIDMLKIVADIPERNVGSVKEGMPVWMVFDAFPGDTVRGTVSVVGSTVSANNRAMSIEIVVRNPGRRLKPEMIAKVRIERTSNTHALVVNEQAVQLVDMNRHVVFVERDGIAQERTVTLGGRQNSHIELVQGVQPGDNVIVSDVEKLVNGLRVKVAQ